MLFSHKKNFRPIRDEAKLVLMDDIDLNIVGIKSNGFVLRASIEKMSYYYNFDQKVEGLFKIYGNSYYLLLSLERISKNETLAIIDLKKSNPLMTAIFSKKGIDLSTAIKKFGSENIELQDGRTFNVRSQIAEIPKDILITYFFKAYLTADDKFEDTISYINNYQRDHLRKKSTYAA